MSQIEKIARLFMSKLLPRTQWEALTNFERAVSLKAAREVSASLDTLQPDVSGLVEALEEAKGCRRENPNVPALCPGCLMSIDKALSQYREGKQWSNEPPSEPGWWWLKGSYADEDGDDIEYEVVTQIIMRGGELQRHINPDIYTQVKYCGGQWYGPIHPPKGEE